MPVNKVTLSQSWNYPIPPPEILARYSPELQAAFTTQWEAEAEHRRHVEITQLEHVSAQIAIKEYDIKKAHHYDLLALFLSFFLIIGLAGAAIYLVIIGQPIAAIAAAFTALAAFWKRKTEK